MMAMKCGQIVDNLNQIKNSVTFLIKEFNGSQGTNSFNKVASSHGELVDDIREMIHSFQLLLDCNVTQFIMSTFTSEDYSALIEELQMQYPVTPMTPLTPITPITPITPVIIGGTLTSRKLSFSRTKSQRKRDRLERLSISVDLSMAPAFQEMQNQGFRLTPLTLTNDLNQTRSTGDVFSFEDMNKLHGNVKKQHPKFMKHSSEPNVLSPMRSSKDSSPNRFTPGTHNSRRSGNSISNNYDRHARFDDNVHMDNLDFGFELDMIDDGCHFENYKSYKNGKEMRKNVNNNNNNDDICNLDYNEIDKMIGSFGQEFGKVGGFDGLGIDILKNNHFKHTTTTTGTSVTTATTDLGDTPTPTMLLFHENQNMVNLHGNSNSKNNKNNKNNKNDNNKNNNGNNSTAMECKNSNDGGNVTTTNEMDKRKDDQLPQETNESEKAGSNVNNQSGDNNNRVNDGRNEELFYVHERKLSKIDTMSMQSGSVHSGNNKSKSGILSGSDNDTLTDNEDAEMTMATQQSEMTDILNSVTPMSDDGTINTINTITTINTINTLNNNMTNTGNNNNGNNNSKKNNNNNKSNNNGLKQNSLASMASASLYKGGNPSLHDRMSSLSIHLDGNGMSLMSHDTTKQHKTRYHDTIDSTNDEFLFLGYAGGDSPNSTTRRDSMSSAALFDDAINEPLPRDAAACYMNHNNNNNNNNNNNTHNTMNNKNSSSLSNKYKTGSESASESSLQRRNGMYLCENGLTNVKNHKNSYNNDCNNEEAHISNISPSDSSVPDIITPPPARSSKARNLPHISEEKSIGADNDNNSKNVRHFERQAKQVNEDRESFLYN